MSSKRPKSRRTNHFWADMTDEELLQIRLKDLGVSVAGTWLEECLQKLDDELAARNVAARGHAWLSDEWFSPHNTPGIAIPFYLAHPRLMKLERKLVLDVEGGTRRECMRILRHEAGHVVQYAYGLHRKKRWQDLFGHASRPYPNFYRPNPASKNFVQHLRRWYAQCHPDEDFAETFAVWLTPRSGWRKQYAEWPGALEKLEYVDELMKEFAGVKPVGIKRFEVDPIGKLPQTLDEHYHAKRDRYAVDAPTIFDRELQRIFSNEPRHKNAPMAAAFVRRNRIAIRRSVARWSGEYPLALDAAVDDIIDRCRALKLHAPGSEKAMRLELTGLLTNKTVRTFYGSSRRQSFAV